MSRRVIEDLVLPIVLRKLQERGELLSYNLYSTVNDLRLTEFFEEQLVKEYGAIGEVGGRCEALEYILEDLASRNPAYLEAEVDRILNLYINLRMIEAQITGCSAPRVFSQSYCKTLAERVRKRRHT